MFLPVMLLPSQRPLNHSFPHEISTIMHKLVGQGYDGASVFSGNTSGVQVRMRVHSAHSLYLHCACHRLQLAGVQAAASIPEIKKVFGMMANLWKLFSNSPQKAEALKEIQAALNLPQLKIVKPSDTWWLSHERCMRAIRKDLPALIATLQHIYETTGDAEAFGLSTLLSCFLLSEVLDILATMNASLQKKTADFSRLHVFLQSMLDELKSLKGESAEWCSKTKNALDVLQEDFFFYRHWRAKCWISSIKVHVDQFNRGISGRCCHSLPGLSHEQDKQPIFG